MMQTRLPQVDKLLRHELILDYQKKYKRKVLLKVVRQILSDARQRNESRSEDEVIALVGSEMEKLRAPKLKKVLNGTGVVLNTNLGRAPISAQHLEALKEIASGYCNLEYDLLAGKRGKRSSGLQELLQILTGAEAALAVNNNAAAVVLAVNCFALGKEVIVSRGELIEIGGSFRLPDVVVAAGGILKEVGTTNKTRAADYEKAIGPSTGLILRCHRSNFELKGFTEEANLSDMVKLCAKHQIPLVEDLGSGALENMTDYGLSDEATVESVVESNCDLITFSGDKLLGGPQAGLIVGKKIFVDKLASHPLYRALRLDKVSIFLLEQALRSYLLANPQDELPSLQMIAADAEEIKKRVEDFIKKFAAQLKHLDLSLVNTASAIGGGSMPGQEKASFGLSIRSSSSSTELSAHLRRCSPPLIAMTREAEVLVDFRTIKSNEESLLFEVFRQLESRISSKV